jgi:hypothetical protein
MDVQFSMTPRLDLALTLLLPEHRAILHYGPLRRTSVV